MEDFSEILKSELPSLTRFENSKISIQEITDIRKKEIKIEEISIIVSSLRLDNVVGELAKTSRNKAVDILKQERVFIDYKNEVKPTKLVVDGNIITIRGCGKFVIEEIAGSTRSGKYVVVVKKFV
jgi:RNA-binding protein YlmH